MDGKRLKNYTVNKQLLVCIFSELIVFHLMHLSTPMLDFSMKLHAHINSMEKITWHLLGRSSLSVSIERRNSDRDFSFMYSALCIVLRLYIYVLVT